MPSDYSRALQSIALAVNFAAKAYEGKSYGDISYFIHVAEVAELVSEELPGGDHYAIMVAYLHDVIEDTSITVEDLRKVFDNSVVSAVVGLTRRKDQTYMEYIKSIKDLPYWVQAVKICDLKVNLKHCREKPHLYPSLIERYENALGVLTSN